MTDFPSAPTPAAPTPEDKPPGADVKNRVMIIWGLYLVSVVFGLTALVGLVLAYIWRSEAAGSDLADHFAKQITTFWIMAIGVVISIPLMLVAVGFFTLIASIIYFLVISVLGLVRANEGRPYNAT